MPLTRPALESMSKAGGHTPGPWYVWQSVADNSINVHGPDRVFVCEVGKISGDGYRDETVKADSRLIAAAPEMLAALRLAYPLLTDKAAREEIGALLLSIDSYRSDHE